jgi:uncharacterized membrane protein YdbT with pleckstrin-like domain
MGILSFVSAGLGDVITSGLLFWASVFLLVRALVLYKTSEFSVTNKRLIAKSGVLSRGTNEIFINKVESVSVSQGAVENMFGAGTVIVRASGGTVQKFKGIADPLGLRSAVQRVQSVE